MGTRGRMLDLMEMDEAIERYVNKNKVFEFDSSLIILKSMIRNRIFQEKIEKMEEDTDKVKDFVENIVEVKI